MTGSSIVAFLVASFTLAMVPGVGTAMLLRQSVRGGRKAAVATVVGMEVGVAVWALAAALGLSVLLVASEIAYQGLRIAGVVVLIGFGIKALLARGAGELGEAPGGSGFRSGLVVNLANPKLAVFAVSFLPQFVEPDAGRWVLVLLAAAWVVIDTIWYLLVLALLTRVMDALKRPRVRTVLERISGVALVGLGIKLAVEG
ncbi:LysE family translocator [Actinokineospora sp. UTMC 2448]|uniref:LysE family translocator n=1 Tax=Actinokineospora sp. UTMC 2448 TaxID=2268449 RepID=UPI0021640623|nr:LysE family translocator [Actinokineospora sp. UTMC 2448]UVS76757.1 Homoserine/homoserine lactone efflux protein [Actinokineospora sp. UTMC 2448]